MREIKKLTPDHVEDYVTIYLHAYPAFKALDDDCREAYRRKTIRDMKRGTDVEFFGLHEDGKLISTMKLVTFSMNIYGKMQKVIGLMSLAVHPLHKKKGAATEMMKFLERYTLDSGAAVSILLPFNMWYYRKMGYGFGAKQDEYHVPTTSLPAFTDMSGLRLLTLDDLPEVCDCHSACAEKSHGMLKKFSEEIYDMEQDTSAQRIGYYENNRLKAYLIYHFETSSDVNYTMNRIVVDEMIYSEASMLKRLLGYLRTQADEVQTIVLRSAEPDFYHVLDDAQDVSGNYIPFGYLQTNVSAVGTMYKIVDPGRFIEMTEYRTFPEADLTVTFECCDDRSRKTEPVTIRFAPDGKGFSRWICVDTDADTPANVSVTCRRSDFSSLLLNACSLSSMIRLGAMEISDASYVHVLDGILYYPQRPFNNSDF